MRGLVSKKAETCFVLPLREAVAHFVRLNAGSTDAKMGCSDKGNAHTSIATAADFTAKWNDRDPLPVCVSLDGGVCR
jgi:hypothetical protein